MGKHVPDRVMVTDGPALRQRGADQHVDKLGDVKFRVGFAVVRNVHGRSLARAGWPVFRNFGPSANKRDRLKSNE